MTDDQTDQTSNQTSFVDPKAEAAERADADDRSRRVARADEIDSLGNLIAQKQQALHARGIQINPVIMLQFQIQHLVDHLVPAVQDDDPQRPLPRSWERLDFERSWAKQVLAIMEQIDAESKAQAQAQRIVVPDQAQVTNLNRQQRRKR